MMNYYLFKIKSDKIITIKFRHRRLKCIPVYCDGTVLICIEGTAWNNLYIKEAVGLKNLGISYKLTILNYFKISIFSLSKFFSLCQCTESGYEKIFHKNFGWTYNWKLCFRIKSNNDAKSIFFNCTGRKAKIFSSNKFL